jgi:hypothetical protein
VDPRAIVWLERLGLLKNSMASSGIKLMTFWLVEQYLNQLHYCVPLYWWENFIEMDNLRHLCVDGILLKLILAR